MSHLWILRRIGPTPILEIKRRNVGASVPLRKPPTKRQRFKAGDVLRAETLNEMQDQIDSLRR